MGQIPFVSKFLAKRRLRSLESDVDKLHGKFEGLKKEIVSAKDKAADLLTKKSYDTLTTAIDNKVEEFCETADEIKDATREASGRVELEKKCKKKAAEKMGWKDARGKKGAELDKWKTFVKKCKDQGGELSGCKL